MFRWYHNWLERRQMRYRALFVYHDGTKTRRADPAKVWRDLLNHPKLELVGMMPLAHANQEPEVITVCEALAEIFEVERWNEETSSGLTTWEMLDLVRQFEEYLTRLKKNTSPWQMPFLHSALQVSTSSASPETQPVDGNSYADSYSTLDASSSDEDTPSYEPFATASEPH